MKDLFLGIIGAALLAVAFQLGRMQQPPPRQLQAPSEPAKPVPTRYDAGPKAVVSLYNPDGRLLKFFELAGPVERSPEGELVFETRDGKKVHTTACYILESEPSGQGTTSGDFGM